MAMRRINFDFLLIQFEQDAVVCQTLNHVVAAPRHPLDFFSGPILLQNERPWDRLQMVEHDERERTVVKHHRGLERGIPFNGVAKMRFRQIEHEKDKCRPFTPNSWSD